MYTYIVAYMHDAWRLTPMLARVSLQRVGSVLRVRSDRRRQDTHIAWYEVSARSLRVGCDRSLCSGRRVVAVTRRRR